MAEYDKTNTFTLNKNDKGDNPKRPDYRGKGNLNGVNFKLGAWLKTGPDGPFLSGAFTIEEDTEERAKPAVEGADDSSIPF
jgi:hypothetical protein